MSVSHIALQNACSVVQHGDECEVSNHHPPFICVHKAADIKGVFGSGMIVMNLFRREKASRS